MTESGDEKNDIDKDDHGIQSNSTTVKLTEESLAEIPAVGDAREAKLKQVGYTTVQSVAEATVDELVTIETIGISDARCIREAAKELGGEDGTIQHQVADDCNVTRKKVSEAFACIAYLKGSLANKKAALKEIFCDESKRSILHLEGYPLNHLYLLYEDGFKTAEDVATASLKELTEVAYIDKDRARNIRASAREIASGDLCGDYQSSTKTESTRDTNPSSEFTCEKCGKSFQFKSVLRKHKYSCDQPVDSHSSQLSEKTDRTSTPSPKGWNVDSLGAATTLDIDEIKDAVNRLTTADCSYKEAIGYVRRYLKEMLQGEGLFAVYGVGPSSGSSLVKAGITTTDDLQAATPRDLSSRTDLSIAQVQRLQEAAQAGNFASLKPGDIEVAEQLIDSTIQPNTQHTNNKQPSKTEAKPAKGVTQFDNSDDGLTSGSDSPSVDVTTSASDTTREILAPGDLPVPDSEEYTVPGGGTVYPNHLSEYYESFRDVKNVLHLVFQLSGTDIDPEDRRDPRVQYFTLIDACIGFSDVSTRFTGYGPQHQNRLSFSVVDYRKVFGDAETVTDYQVINTKPFTDETHNLLKKIEDVKATREFVRPCIPGTDYPIPELPGSFKELQDALQLLATFPAYPPLPTENGINHKTMPIADIYDACFGDLKQESQVDLPSPTTTQSQPTGPVPAATPTSTAEAESKLLDYGRLSHLFRRVTPPADSPVNQVLNVFALDWYRPDSPTFDALQALAKHGEDGPVDTFRPRLQDLIHRRFLLDTWDYDYITVFPGHEAGALSSQLVELAQDAVLETDIIYTPLLERTESVEQQREKSKEKRRQVALKPSTSLRTRAKLHNDAVILFDDICTTGSSLLAGAHLLRQAGADRVVCITLGLTPGGPQTGVKEITDSQTTASDIIAGVE